MCSCAWNFVCARCQPRAAVDDGEWSETELEQWRRNEADSLADFKKPEGAR